MDLYNIIHLLYPDITDNEFVLQDDGKGPYIRDWTYTGALKPKRTDLLPYKTKIQEYMFLRQEADNSLEYLKQTDYKAIRVSEGYTLDEQLKLDREAARQKIREYEQYKLS